LGMRVHRVYMSFAISIGCGIAFSKCGVFAKVSRNRGTTDGLHAGRLAAVSVR